MKPSFRLIAMGMLLGCSGADPVAPPSSEPIAVALIAPDSIAVLENDSARINAYLIDSAGQPLSDVAIAWVSKDTAIATVQNGVVQFRAPGHTVIAVLSEGFSVSINVEAVLRFATVSAGAHYSGFVRWCGITDRGSLWCFPGADGFIYPNTDSLLSFGVPGGGVFRQVSVGPNHVCAVTTTHEAFCWGDNSFGQLGDYVVNFKRQVYYHWGPTLVSGGHQFTSITAGAAHTCALTVTGTAYCWGRGRLGNNTGYKTFQSTPLLVAGGLTFNSIAAGADNTCAIRADSVAVCWGANTQGMLGIGSATPSHSDTAVVVNTNARFVSISMGSNNACGLGSDSAAYCWGSNESNQVGSGPDVCPGAPAWGGCAFNPTPVPGAPRLRALQAAGVGYNSDATTCGITPAGDLFCWGSNRWGQTGDGTTGSSSTPVSPAASGLSLAALYLGSQFSCGSVAAGTVYCWGLNYGPVPVRLPFQP